MGGVFIVPEGCKGRRPTLASVSRQDLAAASACGDIESQVFNYMFNQHVPYTHLPSDVYE